MIVSMLHYHPRSYNTYKSYQFSNQERGYAFMKVYSQIWYIGTGLSLFLPLFTVLRASPVC